MVPLCRVARVISGWNIATITRVTFVCKLCFGDIRTVFSVSRTLYLREKLNIPAPEYIWKHLKGEGGGGGARRCARDAASPAQAHAPASAPPAPHAGVKSERLSPHDSTASRSRSVTPSTSSYPGTPPERGSPHAPPAPVHPPRNYSDIMRSLAARYNTHPTNDYFHRINGFAVEQRAPAQTQVDANDVPVGGLFAKLAKQQGGPPRLPAFPVMLDMSSTKTLLAISRVGRGGRSRRKRVTGTTTEHSPLDLSAAGESAAKRARLSASPSTRSDGDERASNEDRSENRECLCAEARARLSAWCVDEVCDFVSSIDICAEYASNFREQRIDGAGLPLLTEEHLTVMLQMKLGPALKLRAVLARRLEPCTQCQAAAAAANTTPTNTPKINGTSLKSEPRSNTTSPS
ncbi:uncharacterized protein LOC120628729 isoform X1 [Pararge aegeria]|uniref:uncharacterized protein LOC120628729 isoform X1 n=1 Tax=Pararge aegeria TaxID=116150 RepID=UPI0019CF9000|nr:uncharacterized protein LOC120628729 isoform X1 [Pararge aegeria]